MKTYKGRYNFSPWHMYLSRRFTFFNERLEILINTHGFTYRMKPCVKVGKGIGGPDVSVEIDSPLSAVSAIAVVDDGKVMGIERLHMGRIHIDDRLEVYLEKQSVSYKREITDMVKGIALSLYYSDLWEEFGFSPSSEFSECALLKVIRSTRPYLSKSFDVLIFDERLSRLLRKLFKDALERLGEPIEEDALFVVVARGGWTWPTYGQRLPRENYGNPLCVKGYFNKKELRKALGLYPKGYHNLKFLEGGGGGENQE